MLTLEDKLTPETVNEFVAVASEHTFPKAVNAEQESVGTVETV